MPGPENPLRLISSDAYDFHNLTWGGQSYETADGLVSGNLQTTTSLLSAGFDIAAT